MGILINPLKMCLFCLNKLYKISLSVLNESGLKSQEQQKCSKQTITYEGDNQTNIK